MTGHPALTMPVSSLDGLPVGGMMIGRRFDDVTLVSIAARYERAIGWDPAVLARQGVATGPSRQPVT